MLLLVLLLLLLQNITVGPGNSSLALSTRAATLAGVGKYTVWRWLPYCRIAKRGEHSQQKRQIRLKLSECDTFNSRWGPPLAWAVGWDST